MTRFEPLPITETMDQVFEQVARLQVVSTLDDEPQNPVVWSRTRQPTFA